jgi:subtilisin family serine protease
VARKAMAKAALALVTTAAALALAGSTGAQAEPPPAAESAGIYLVQTSGVPIAAYDGSDVSAHRKALADGRKAVLAKVPGVEKIYDYETAFNGFAAKLTGPEAAKLARTPGVLGVWKNEVRKLDTTSTPKFLGLTGDDGVWAKQFGGDKHAGEGVIVGMVDSGVWPENPAFAALPEPRPDAKAIKKKWKGTCDHGADTADNNVTCNNKLIGARYFHEGVKPVEDEFESPRDFGGHGTHTASTVAGDFGVDAVINGSSRGKMSGMAPAARIAVYKVCWETGGDGGCGTVDSVAAIDQAVADGVDVINFSISGSTSSVVDPVEIAFYNAAKAGVFVSASAGNEGPGESTVAHNSPWLTTVAASTHDRAFRATVTVGNGTTLTGAGLGDAVPSSPLVLSDNVGKAGAPATEVHLCYPGQLDPAKVAGKIVACARGVNARVDKSLAVKQAGGVGMILYNTSAAADDIASDFHYVPTVHVKVADGKSLVDYAGQPGATAALGKGVQYVAEAPEMASFSSAGPALAGDGDLLKPDITAPGVDVIAAVAPPGNAGANFASYQGTSMSSPHIAGLAALLIGKHPTWDPMWVKSALMTTATQVDNKGNPIKRGSANATPFDFGAGHVNPKASFDPGLVYDSTPRDWVAYMCALGQGQSIGAPCKQAGTIDPSDLNYPSIAVGDLAGSQTVTRRVTNTTGKLAYYRSTVEAPAGTKVTVRPAGLLVPPHRTVSYQVKITRTDGAFGDYSFGALTWNDGRGHQVRSGIVVRPVAVAAPKSASGSGTSGRLQLAVKAGYDGTLNASAAGLVADTVTDLPLANPDGSGFDTDHPATGEHTGKVSVTVPEGAKLARFATFDADYASLGEGTDIDLFVYKKTADGLELVGDSATATAEESVTLTEPGEYEIYVDLYALPAGVSSATVKHHHWVLGDPAGNLTLAPESQRVGSGDSASVTVSWSGLQAGTRYLGAVLYSDEDAELGSTILTVTG